MAVAKWEDSPGLEHGCGICGTSMNNPKARKTCYGTHSEPCVRYHHTMFIMGNSHSCEPCRNSNALHMKRHKEIAEIIHKIHEIDGDIEPGSRRSSIASRSALEDGVDVNSRRGSEYRVKKSNELKRGASVRERREQRRATKLEKDITKALKHQEKLGSAVPLSIQTDKVDKAIHGDDLDADADNSMTPQRAQAVLVTCMKKFQELQNQKEEQHSKSPDRRRPEPSGNTCSSPENGDNGTNKAELPLIREIFAELGIRLKTDGSSKERKTLVAKAAEAIYGDIEAISNEARETMKRATGYWRWANKRVFNGMVRNSYLVDWETGENLPDSSIEPEEEETPEKVAE
ncbi:hypothetical protein FQN57_000767 [Myotisia sp. PD_48]|nr:hypothetical protein FQN57_000767 [Myotisia sp. PD_48]